MEGGLDDRASKKTTQEKPAPQRNGAPDRQPRRLCGTPFKRTGCTNGLDRFAKNARSGRSVESVRPRIQEKAMLTCVEQRGRKARDRCARSHRSVIDPCPSGLG